MDRNHLDVLVRKVSLNERNIIKLHSGDKPYGCSVAKRKSE